MANTAETIVLTSTIPENETPMEKTTRIMRRITEDEAEIRHQKTARLRKDRFEGG